MRSSGFAERGAGEAQRERTMSLTDARPSTGLPAVDTLVKGLRLGDNVVWEVETIDDYAAFVAPFVETALGQGREVLYFRFARHAPLVPDDERIRRVELDPQAGFETFLDAIHCAVEDAGKGAYHVFDSLSDLVADWYCDQMVGNFFQLTCPRLYELETIAYFGLLRGFHSSYATVLINETTQLLIAVYRREGKFYIQPLKVQERSSPHMYMLHALEEGATRPVTESHTVSEILTSSPRVPLGLTQQQIGVWTHTFVQAETLLEQVRKGEAAPKAVDAMVQRLLRMTISRDERVLRLARRYFDLANMVAIGRRLLGTGLIGGKSVGMLLARAILEQTDPRWTNLLEVHDSFYIPSDIFYTFLVRNGCWEIRKRQLKTTDYVEGAEKARQCILEGTFPEHIEKRFAAMLDYFGQSPIIVRSRSLLEDNFGNSFAGKYESVFCANQGSRDERLANFMAAVKTVYASTLSQPALSYRARHNLLDRDEQMALLVQRVSGAFHGKLQYPHVAGVAFSFNPYVWSAMIDPKAGMLRLVFGLGTRAVDRSDQDYTRIVALNAPQRRPEANRDEMQQYAQHNVDVLDLEANRLVTADFHEVMEQSPDVPIELFARRDAKLARLAHERGIRTVPPHVLTFDALISRTNFIRDMRDMLTILEEAYEYPVDTEFTVNFLDKETYKINLLQCRPFHVRAGVVPIEAPGHIDPERIVLETAGPVIGQSRVETIQRVIYVVPSVYGQLPIPERHGVARLIGRLNHLDEDDRPDITMLLGPGRWGTTTPSLGVPVSFAEINTVSVVCEIVAMREDLVPDVSLGTHFFSELVEVDALYLALFPNQENNLLKHEFFEGSKNLLRELLPDAAAYEHVIRVIDATRLPDRAKLTLHADTVKQRVMCYLEP